MWGKTPWTFKDSSAQAFAAEPYLVLQDKIIDPSSVVVKY